jgi:hypothetical protein
MVAVVDLSVIDEAFGPTSDLYTDVLGVKSNASGEQIQRAYFERRNDLFGLLADMDAEEQDSITESHRFHAERQLDAVVMTLRILGDPTARSQYDDLRDDRTSGALGGGQAINNSAASVAAMMKKSSFLAATSTSATATPSRSYSMEAEEVSPVATNSHKQRSQHRRLRSRRSRGVPGPPPDPPSSIPHGGSSVSSGLDYPQPPLPDDDEDDDDDHESRNNRNSPVRSVRRSSSEKHVSPSVSPSPSEQHQHRSSNSSSSKRRSRKVTPEPVRPRPPKQKSSKQPPPPQVQQPKQKVTVIPASPIANKSGDVSDTEESAYTLETVRTERTLDYKDEVATLGTYADDASFVRMQEKRSTLQMVHDEIVGAIDDTSRSVEQVFSAFTLSDSDIKAVCSRIDRAVMQMNRSLKG